MSDAATPGIVAPATRDLDTLAAALRDWLAPRLGDPEGLRIEDLRYPLGAGMSHETILFDAAWRDAAGGQRRGLVVRIKPSGAPVYLDDMFAEQYRLMRTMRDSGLVRVAEALWFEDSPDLLGAPFFVMEKVAGRVAVSYPPYSQAGWLVDDATPNRRRAMWTDAVTQLAMIQRVPVADVAWLAPPGGPQGFDQEVDRWTRYLAWIDPTGELALLRDAFDRLLAKAPANRPEGIVWGDARLGNMMIGADWRVAAVMDWEQPSLGGALHDLGWWLLSDHTATAGRGLEPLPGMGTREETIALWQAVSGKSANDLAWYEAFAVFKQECLGTNMSRMSGSAAKPLPFSPGTWVSGVVDRL